MYLLLTRFDTLKIQDSTAIFQAHLKSRVFILPSSDWPFQPQASIHQPHHHNQLLSTPQLRAPPPPAHPHNLKDRESGTYTPHLALSYRSNTSAMVGKVLFWAGFGMLQPTSTTTIQLPYIPRSLLLLLSYPLYSPLTQSPPHRNRRPRLATRH